MSRSSSLTGAMSDSRLGGVTKPIYCTQCNEVAAKLIKIISNHRLSASEMEKLAIENRKNVIEGRWPEKFDASVFLRYGVLMELSCRYDYYKYKNRLNLLKKESELSSSKFTSNINQMISVVEHRQRALWDRYGYFGTHYKKYISLVQKLTDDLADQQSTDVFLKNHFRWKRQECSDEG